MAKWYENPNQETIRPQDLSSNNTWQLSTAVSSVLILQSIDTTRYIFPFLDMYSYEVTN